MKVSRIFVLLSIICLVYSCKKNTGLSGYVKDLEISYTDTLAIGKNIRFFSTAPADSKFLWTFGTGITSTSDSPFYMYYVPRSYIVSLQINDTGKPVTKTIYISIGLDILGKITKGRSWNVHYTAHNPSGVPADTDTVYATNESYFSVNNDTSLSTSISVLGYMAPSTVLPVDRMLKFGTGNIGSSTSFWSVAYYEYSKDSLEYIIYNPLPGGYTRTEYSSSH